MININTWINSIVKPKETFSAEKTNADIGKGAINYAIAGLISGILGFIVSIVFSASLGANAGLVAGVGFIGIVLSPILAIVGAFIGQGVFFLIAKLLGGNGSYPTQFYLASLYAVPIAILSAVPLVGLIAGLYAIYLLFLVISETHSLSSGKAAVAVLIPIIIIVILAIVVGAIAGLALFGAAGSIAPTGYVPFS